MSITNSLRPVVDYSLPFRSAYSPRVRQQISFPENSPFTKQEFKDEADINVLMSRYQSTGELPAINQVAPQYLDVTGFDYQTHMTQIAEAQSLFASLPSKIRNRFDNDPGQFLEFCSNSENRLEMAEMGLLKDPSEWVDYEAAQAYQSRLRGNPAPNNPNPNNTAPAHEDVTE